MAFNVDNLQDQEVKSGKPDIVISEETHLHQNYLEIRQIHIEKAIFNAVVKGFLVTGFVSSKNLSTGDELIYLIKWKRAYNEN